MNLFEVWLLVLAQAGRYAPLHLNLIKLIPVILIYVLWVFTIAWADRENKEHRLLYLQRTFWNNVLFWSMVAGILLMFLIPEPGGLDPVARWIIWGAKLLLLIAAYLIPTWLYIATRNRNVPMEDAITLATIYAETMALLGVRVRVRRRKKSFGPPIRFVTASGQQARMQEPETEDPEEATALAETWLATKELMYDAIKRRATDVLMEPRGQAWAVVYKIDGVLLPSEPLEPEIGFGVLTTLKSFAGLDPNERRKPQSGEFKAVVKGEEIPIRIRTLGTRAGERMHLQIFQEQVHPENLEDLGLRESTVEQLKEVVAQPSGIILVGGPKESGKTTTAHALIRAVDRFVRNVATLEDDFTYKLETVTRNKVDPSAGETPFTKLRSVVRTEPDVVMVDELRDHEAAQLVAKAAADRLFVVTLQGADVPSTIARFRELVGDAQAAASHLLAVVSTRLVRKLCEECKEAYQPNPQALQRLNLAAAGIKVFYRPPPPPERDEDICPQCSGLGYYGRTGIFEVLIVNDAVRQAVAAGADPKQIRAVARTAGMVSLFEDGLRQVVRGVTSLQEITRVLNPAGATPQRRAPTRQA